MPASQHSSRGGVTALIWGASPQMRCERKKDRVEVNPELLAAATAQAEISFFPSISVILCVWFCVEKPNVGVSGVGVGLNSARTACRPPSARKRG